MDRERPSASHSEGEIPEAWIGQEVMIETTEALSTDLRAAAPVRLEAVNDRGIVVLVSGHHEHGHPHRYFYPWGVVGWIRLAAEEAGSAEPSEEPAHLRDHLFTGLPRRDILRASPLGGPPKFAW